MKVENKCFTITSRTNKKTILTHDVSWFVLCSFACTCRFTIVYSSLTFSLHLTSQTSESIALHRVPEYSLVFIKFCNFITVQLWVWVKQATETTNLLAVPFLSIKHLGLSFAMVFVLSPTVVMSSHYYLCSKLVSFSTEITQTICLILVRLLSPWTELKVHFLFCHSIL